MKVFIDGKSGTTGLRIYDRLGVRDDVELITLPEQDRKSPEARKKALNESDIAFLCLPDAAAVEAAEMVENPDTVVIDTSTAHRTSPDWCYGFPELGEGFADKLVRSKRIAVPGCHASGFIALVYPLVEQGIISADTLLTCYSLTGYSGGGKKMIAEYEEAGRAEMYDAPRIYGLTQQHKHLPEMMSVTGLLAAPVFCPVVADYYSGMLVTVPVFSTQLCAGKTCEDIKACYAAKYSGPVVSYVENADEHGLMSANRLSGMDCMQISVSGNDERIMLLARYDNLGKGASGAALECMNIVSGNSAETGLNLI